MFDGYRLAALVVATAIGLAGSAQADGASQGVWTVTAMDLVARTVTIDSRVYRVTQRTIIVDVQGRRIGLQGVPVSGPGQPELIYEYEAAETGGRRVLERLRVSEVPR